MQLFPLKLCEWPVHNQLWEEFTSTPPFPHPDKDSVAEEAITKAKTTAQSGSLSSSSDYTGNWYWF